MQPVLSRRRAYSMCTQASKARSMARVVLDWVDVRPPFQDGLPAGRASRRTCLLRVMLGFPLTYCGLVVPYYSLGTCVEGQESWRGAMQASASGVLVLRWSRGTIPLIQRYA